MTIGDESKKNRVRAPRLAILACPAGAWVGITQAATGPVTEAALYGTGTTVGVLLLPVVLSTVAKASTHKAAKPKAAPAKTEKTAKAPQKAGISWW
ncbi:hypothetical protein [Streptomyces abyssomicinicus]|uniref:hypothetical protein n=1 Tax=Streptomyces abyssomicinicus TaxID=574929 RepID=UPI001250C246|nr:hypothetical protein [Streptomyces abyssomicinicus]